MCSHGSHRRTPCGTHPHRFCLPTVAPAPLFTTNRWAVGSSTAKAKRSGVGEGPAPGCSATWVRSKEVPDQFGGVVGLVQEVTISGPFIAFTEHRVELYFR